MQSSRRLQTVLSLWFITLCLAYHALAGPTASTVALPLPQALLEQYPPSTSLPPLLAALTALTDPLPAPTSNATSAVQAGNAASSSSLAIGRAIAAPAALDSLRPAAAAALARQHSDPSAPLTDADITAINILLSREGPPKGPYCYDTGLPAVPHLVSFGNTTLTNFSSSKSGSSMLSNERLGRLSALGPLSWLARSYAVTGDTLLKLRITQQLQLILQDAISDSLASSANIPPNQVVTFAASNLTFGLEFTGVDWDDEVLLGPAMGAGAAAVAAAELPHKGLKAVKQALQQLTGNYDPKHTMVSLLPFAQPRGVPRSTAAVASKPKVKAGTTASPGAAAAAAGTPGAAAGNMARRLLRGASQQQFAAPASGSSSSNTRRLSGTSQGPTQSRVVYVRLYGMDPMNVTTLMERLGNCSARPLQEAGASQQAGSLPASAAAAMGRMPAIAPGRPMQPSCAEVFRQELQAARVPISSGPAFTVAPFEKPTATINIAVAVGLTPEQQAGSDTDVKAGSWLNSTAMQDILGTFNLTVTSNDQQFVTFLRDRDSGRFPPLPGFNLTNLIPSLFETVLAAGRNISQQQGAQQQQAQTQQGALVPSASAAFNKSILAGIIVAVVASVLALVGVVALLLRRRSDNSSKGSQQQDDPEAEADGVTRRRRRRPRVYHTKYLSDAAPVLGHTLQPEPGSTSTAAGTSATSVEGQSASHFRQCALERGDSVMSQVNLELDHEDGDEDSSEAGGSTSSLVPVQRQQQPQRRQEQRQQQQLRLPVLQRQQGDAGSSGSSSMQALLNSMQPTSSNASSAVVVIPADAAARDDAGSSSCRTLSMDLAATRSSGLSPWGSGHEAHMPAAAGGGRHRLAVASHAPQPQESTAAAQDQGPATQQHLTAPQQQHGAGGAAPSSGAGSSSSVQKSTVSIASAFAAMDAQLTAADAASGSRSAGGGGSSGGGSSGSEKVQPLGQSCWHKYGHVSGFIVPEGATGASSGGGSAAGSVQQQGTSQRRPGALLSPFAAAIQLAHSVASDEV